MDTFSRRLKMLRLEAGYKQSDLATAMHTSVSVISNYENGREPPYGMLVQFAQYFGVTTDYLLGLSSTKQPDNGALLAEVNRAAKLTEQTGAQPIAAAEAQALFTALIAYTKVQAPAGKLPVDFVHSQICRMTEMLKALTSRNVAEVLDANNVLLKSLLDVSDITAEYVNRNE